jgi:hypothetical protein
MNGRTWFGEIPANVLVNDLANVTAGFANEVDAVNQYAAVMYAATRKGMTGVLVLSPDKTTSKSPKVATASLNH